MKAYQFNATLHPNKKNTDTLSLHHKKITNRIHHEGQPERKRVQQQEERVHDDIAGAVVRHSQTPNDFDTDSDK